MKRNRFNTGGNTEKIVSPKKNTNITSKAEKPISPKKNTNITSKAEKPISPKKITIKSEKPISPKKIDIDYNDYMYMGTKGTMVLDEKAYQEAIDKAKTKVKNKSK